MISGVICLPMALNSLLCADVPLRTYTLTLTLSVYQFENSATGLCLKYLLET